MCEVWEGLRSHEEGVSMVAFASDSCYGSILRVLPVFYGSLGVVYIALFGFIGGFGIGCCCSCTRELIGGRGICACC